MRRSVRPSVRRCGATSTSSTATRFLRMEQTNYHMMRWQICSCSCNCRVRKSPVNLIDGGLRDEILAKHTSTPLLCTHIAVELSVPMTRCTIACVRSFMMPTSLGGSRRASRGGHLSPTFAAGHGMHHQRHSRRPLDSSQQVRLCLCMIGGGEEGCRACNVAIWLTTKSQAAISILSVFIRASMLPGAWKRMCQSNARLCGYPFC